MSFLLLTFCPFYLSSFRLFVFWLTFVFFTFRLHVFVFCVFVLPLYGSLAENVVTGNPSLVLVKHGYNLCISNFIRNLPFHCFSQHPRWSSPLWSGVTDKTVEGVVGVEKRFLTYVYFNEDNSKAVKDSHSFYWNPFFRERHFKISSRQVSCICQGGCIRSCGHSLVCSSHFLACHNCHSLNLACHSCCHMAGDESHSPVLVWAESEL